MSPTTPHNYQVGLQSQLIRLKARISSAIDTLHGDNQDKDFLLAIQGQLEDIAQRDVFQVVMDPEALRLLQSSVVHLESSLEQFCPPRRSNDDTREVEGIEERQHHCRAIVEINRKIALASFLLGEVVPLNAPLSTDIDPSIACNFSCRICHHSISKKDKRRFLPVSVIDKLSSAFPYIKEIHLFGGGEPTLSPTLEYLVQRLYEAGNTADILTNGSTLGKRALPLSRLSAIGVSFDAANARTFEAIRVGSRFKRLCARIRSFRREFPSTRMYFNTVVSRVNLDELPAIVRLAGELRLSHVSIHRMIPLYEHHAAMELTVVDREEVLRTVALAREEAERFGIILEGDLEPNTLRNDPRPPTASRTLQKEELLTMLEARPLPQDGGALTIEESVAQIRSALHTVVEISKVETQTNQEKDQTLPSIEILHRLEERLESLRGTTVSIPSCAVPWFRTSVRADGTVRPCSMMNIRMGCIETTGNFFGVWRSSEYEALRSLHVSAKTEPDSKFHACQRCNFPERTLFLDQVREYAASFDLHLETKSRDGSC
jgi:MoaA/NifB/PqqE/SkfB family radical SAM enzyme